MSRPGLVVLSLYAVAALFAGFAMGSRARPEGAEAHQRADAVERPAFAAAFNEWVLEHPKGPEEWRGLDAGDVRRFRAVREAWRRMEEGYRAAGY
jgi:hypothetical protein